MANLDEACAGMIFDASPQRIQRSGARRWRIAHPKASRPPSLRSMSASKPSEVAKRDPFSGKVVTGGIATHDSSWLLSWTGTGNRTSSSSPRARSWFGSTLFVENRRLREETDTGLQGEDHPGMALPPGCASRNIPELAATGAKPSVMMPCVTAFYATPGGDRPDVVLRALSTSSWRLESRSATALPPVPYERRWRLLLLDVERGVPEVFNSSHCSCPRPAACATAGDRHRACVLQSADEQARQNADRRAVASSVRLRGD
jgi:hypothetical protein